MREAIVVDVRELPSPEPLERIVKELGNIDENRYIQMVHRMEPMLLYPILNKNGFGYKKVCKDDAMHIYIYRKSDRAMAEYIGSL